MKCEVPLCLEIALYQTSQVGDDGKAIKFGPLKCSRHYQIECSNIAIELYKLNGIKVINPDGSVVV